MKVLASVFLFVFFMKDKLGAQYAPQAGLVGSTAIFKDSNIIKAWGDSVVLQLGKQNICDTLGLVNNGTNIDAIGKADGSVISLGDSGVAIYYFKDAIYDGFGADFAIFENGFINPADSNFAFLELANVYVSSDGVNYEKFPSYSNTQDSIQIVGSGTYMDARKIHNLAGKYIVNYGVPFDLTDIAFSSKVQINNIHYVKIVDVIGNVNHNCYSSLDYNGNIINDPYPTNFITGGFDLDAIGVMYKYGITNILENNIAAIKIFPNPVISGLSIDLNNTKLDTISITDVLGRNIFCKISTEKNVYKIDFSEMTAGIYFIKINNSLTKIIKQ